MGELMQERFACLTARMQCENFAAELAEILKPFAEVLRELRVDLAAQALGDRGALAGG
jgi:hypothetical protein